MSQAFTILAIVGFSLAAVLVVVAVIMYVKLNIRAVRNDLTGKTATRSIAEIRARTKSRKRTTSEAGKRLGWESSEPLKVPSGPLKSYVTGVATKDIDEAEQAAPLLADDADSEGETTTLTPTQAPLIEEDESATTVLANADEEEGATTVLAGMDEEEGATTLLSNDAGDEGETTMLKESFDTEGATTLLTERGSVKITSSIVVLLVAALVFTLGPGAVEAQGAYNAQKMSVIKSVQAAALKSIGMNALQIQEAEGEKTPPEITEEGTNTEELAAAQGQQSVHTLEGSDDPPLLEPDTTDPVFGKITIEPNSKVFDGIVYSSDSVTLYVEVSDPEVDGEECKGIDPNGARVYIDGVQYPETYPTNKVVYEPATHDTPERFRIVFEAEAENTLDYNLEDIVITIQEPEGQPISSGPLAGDQSVFEIKGTDADDETTEVSVTGFVLSDTPFGISLSLDGADAVNENYYNTSIAAVVRIKDSRFERLKGRNPFKSRVIATIETVDGTKEELCYDDFVLDTTDPDGITWMCQKDLSAEGHYTISGRYQSVFAPPQQKRINGNFTIDTTPPTIDTASLTPTGPITWNWITSQDEVSLVFGVGDTLSGIDDEATVATIAGVEVNAQFSSTQKTITLSFPAENKRILFDDIDLKLYDMAHNEAATLKLRELLDTSVGKDVLGFIADSEAPVIDVSYDVNSPQNGQYYNTDRTVTFTITESSFDLIKANKPNNAIVNIQCDGSTSSLQVKDFTDRDGDGRTWVASHTFNADGTYQLKANLTDIAGNASSTFTDSFIIDQTKPSILLSFDNNDMQSGMYFKAPRTATLRIGEKNFSPDLTSVVISAKDAAGNAVGAPALSGWSQTSEGVWEATVHFNQELHYSLTINCTDLAGNVAEEVVEPEFVIDMTAPIVRVDRVSNNTAYAEEIAPRVYFEDVNFEPYRAKVSLTASNQEHVYFSYDEDLTTTSNTLTYKDFDYELRYDDVYTLVATIEDKAGNTAEETVVFSVNRFGSNYEFSTETKPFVGTYLQKPKEVVIIETNVSGLASSDVRMSRNDDLNGLIEDEDYTVTTLSSQSGWSRYEYVLPASLFEEDGYYRILLSSDDLAGNYSENLMMGKNETRDGAFEVMFAVDGTSPVASLGSISDDAAVFSPSHLIDVYAGDNMHMKEATLYVNNEPVQSWSVDEFYASALPAYELAANDIFNDVKLEVKDYAGNTTMVEASNVLITNDIIRYIANTPAILYPLIAALSVLVALALVLVVHLVRKTRAAKEAEAS